MCCAEAWNNQHRPPGGGGEARCGGQALNDVWRKRQQEENGTQIVPKVPSSPPQRNIIGTNGSFVAPTELD